MNALSYVQTYLQNYSETVWEKIHKGKAQKSVYAIVHPYSFDSIEVFVEKISSHVIRQWLIITTEG